MFLVICIGEVDVDKLVNDGWIKAWLVYDTQAVDKKTLKGNLSGLSDKFKMLKEVRVIEEAMTEPELVEPPEKFKEKGIKHVFSQVLEIDLLAKDFETLFFVVITFPPSAIEVLAPKEIKLGMREMQNTLLLTSELIRKYASAGAGGVVITKV